MMPKLPPPYGVLHGVQVWHGDDLLAYGHAVAEAKDAEIAELRAELAAVRQIMDDAEVVIRRQHDARKELEAERDALLADAERYRWLREMATPELGKIAHLHSRSIKTNFSTPMAVLEANVRGDVDAAIDAALAAKG